MEESFKNSLHLHVKTIFVSDCWRQKMDNEDSAVAQDQPEVHSKIKLFDINEARLLRKKN